MAAAGVVMGAVLLLGPDAQGPGSGLFADGMVSRDLDAIRADTLRVLVMDHHMVYQRVGMVETGLEYEVLERFARKEKIPIKAVPVPHPDSVLTWLQRGRGDIAAVQLNGRSVLARSMGTSLPYRFVSPVLLTLRGDPLCAIAPVDGADPDSAWVSTWSPFAPAERMLPGDVTQGGGERVLFTDTGRYGDAPVVNVALGRVRAAVITDASASYFLGGLPQLAMSEPLAEPVPLVFGMRTNARSLRRRLDDHLADPQEKEAITMLMSAYSTLPTLDRDHVLPGCRCAVERGADHLTLAAILFRSDPDTLPAAETRDDPRAQLLATAHYLDELDSAWRVTVPDPSERLAFVAASYVAGAGHVMDAQALAKALGLDPGHWACHVERALALLSIPRYFTNPVVRHGPCAGGPALVRVREALCAYAATPAGMGLRTP